MDQTGVEIARKTLRVGVVDAHHRGKEIVHEAHFHLGVGEVERVVSAIEVIALDEVARLIEQGQGRSHGLGGHVELRGRHIELLQFKQVRVEAFHRIKEERGRSAAEPIVVKPLVGEHIHQAKRIENVVLGYAAKSRVLRHHGDVAQIVQRGEDALHKYQFLNTLFYIFFYFCGFFLREVHLFYLWVKRSKNRINSNNKK